MLHKNYNRKCSVGKKKNTGRGFQGACRQDELIGGKPPVVKYLWLCELSWAGWWATELVSEFVRELVRVSRCEVLLLEAGS
jgi:hypothetical protein